MQKRLPAIITVLLIGAAVLFLAQRQKKASAPESVSENSPIEAVIWRMTDAAREGNAEAYLQCFDGALKQNLTKTRAEMGEAQFQNYLKRLNDEVTGVAVSDLEQPNANEASLRVEFVFRGRNEAQRHHFKFAGGQWLIDNVDGAERLNTLVPYGTSATEQ